MIVSGSEVYTSALIRLIKENKYRLATVDCRMANNNITDRLSFSKKEDLAILEFILKDNRLYFSGGLNVWKKAVNEGICPGRGFWSLKERFMKTICKNLQTYNLPLEIRHKILNYIKASPAEKKRLRIEYGDEQDYKYIHQSPRKTSTPDEENVTNNENIIIKKEAIKPIKDANNSLRNQAETEPKLKSPLKCVLDRENYVKKITFEKKSTSYPNNENISENLTAITDRECNLFKDIPLDRANNVSDPIVTETKCKSFEQSGKCSVKAKQSLISKSKIPNALPVTEKRHLRVTLTKLKNL